MIRSFILLMYLSVMLLLIAVVSENVKASESKQIHNLTTIKYVVKIECDNGSGSGVIINGKVLTALHVVSNQNKCYAIDYKNKAYELSAVKIDEERDLALMDADGKLPVKGIRLSKHKKQKMYDDIYTIGFPLGIDTFWINKGQYISDKDYFSLTNLSVIWGNSGGGVFAIENGEIRLVGIVHALTMYRNVVIKDMTSYSSLNSIREFLK